MLRQLKETSLFQGTIWIWIKFWNDFRLIILLIMEKKIGNSWRRMADFCFLHF